MKLTPKEIKLTGKWEVVNDRVCADSTCARIEWLLTNHLQKLAVNKESGGWETLFQDPADGRFWERTFPQGEMPGGGPPQLLMLSTEQARAKYELTRA